MVACIPCAAAVATPSMWASFTTFFGLGTAATLAMNKRKKTMKKKRSQKGGHKVMKKTKRKRKKYKYNVFKKDIETKCCRCHYVKTGKTLRRVKGPYSHCSYDSMDCCKDKKTIVKSKK